jgi:hypothetical protein
LSHIIDPDEAKQFRTLGEQKSRLPWLKNSYILTPESYLLRGIDVAMTVLNRSPYQYDTEGYRIPANHNRLKSHMQLGLYAIDTVDKRPLVDEFIEGYETTVKAFTEPGVMGATLDVYILLSNAYAVLLFWCSNIYS